MLENNPTTVPGNAAGGVTGSYTYVDEAGPHTVNYVADDFGFRVAASNLPVGPVYAGAAPVAPVYTGVAPVDTPEVAAAKAEFFAAYEAQAALNRRRRSAPAVYPYAGAYAPATALPYAAAAPATAAREAVLTTIKLNPGHAVFYRVD